MTTKNTLVETRTVNIALTTQEHQNIVEAIGHENHRLFEQALGYLSTWNLNYPIVNIYLDGNTDMVAVYKRADLETGYVIGAVWHEDHYGFHS
jgi:hypothetical protein